MPEPVLAIDIGGTKILAALVADGAVLHERQIVTERNLGADAWCEAVAGLAAGWRGRFDRVGAAVTGIVADGRWHALNVGILPVPAGFPIVEALSTRLGCPVLAINDAQAAAWGEFRFGAGQARDLVFLTVSDPGSAAASCSAAGCWLAAVGWPAISASLAITPTASE